MTATQVCGLFNNLKHTKNSDSLVLKPGISYDVLRHHRGQYLLKLSGKTPAQRWVDESCLSSHRVLEAVEDRTISQKNLLALSWHNAFCETHRYKKECKNARNRGNFTLHGLWPQPKGKVYCGVPRLFQKNVGKRLRIEQVRRAFDQSFGPGSGSRVELRCKRGFITEVWLHLGRSDRTLTRALSEGSTVNSRCRYGIVDRAGYGR